MPDDIEYVQQSMMDATGRLEEARKRFQQKHTKQYVSPVERKVDMKKYEGLPEGAVEKDVRLLVAGLQRHVLDLEMKILSFDAKVQDLETMFTSFMSEMMTFIDEMNSDEVQEPEQ